MFLVVQCRHDHVDLEEMLEHSEELALLAIGADVVNLFEGSVRVHGNTMRSISDDWAVLLVELVKIEMTVTKERMVD